MIQDYNFVVSSHYLLSAGPIFSLKIPSILSIRIAFSSL